MFLHALSHTKFRRLCPMRTYFGGFRQGAAEGQCGSLSQSRDAVQQTGQTILMGHSHRDLVLINQSLHVDQTISTYCV